MSETTTTTCDMCAKALRPHEVHYRLERNDQYGYYDSLDLCSAECLAVSAIGEGHERGVRENHAAVQRKLAAAPKRTRKWWNR